MRMWWKGIHNGLFGRFQDKNNLVFQNNSHNIMKGCERYAKNCEMALVIRRRVCLVSC